jgi:hypothetical protein
MKIYRGWKIEGPGFLGIWSAYHLVKHDESGNWQVCGMSEAEVKEAIKEMELDFAEAA